VDCLHLQATLESSYLRSVILLPLEFALLVSNPFHLGNLVKYLGI